jgi:hypothetical protein
MIESLVSKLRDLKGLFNSNDTAHFLVCLATEWAGGI